MKTDRDILPRKFQASRIIILSIHLNSFQLEDLKELPNTKWEKIFHHKIKEMKKKHTHPDSGQQ